MYAGVVNDKTYGGVFVSADGGTRWKQIAEGLEGRDVFALAQGQRRRDTRRNQQRHLCIRRDAHATGSLATSSLNTVAKPVNQVVHGKHVTVEKKVKEGVRELLAAYTLWIFPAMYG